MWLYIAEDVASKFDISNYVVDRPLPITKNKAVVGVMKDEIDGLWKNCWITSKNLPLFKRQWWREKKQKVNEILL